MARHPHHASGGRRLTEAAAAVAVVLVVLGTLVVMRVGDGGPASGGGTGTGRIEGRVVQRPVCPVEGVRECSSGPRPMEVVIEVLAVSGSRDTSSEGRLVTRLNSDQRGRFTVELPPGDYVLRPLATQPSLTAVPSTAHVVAGETTVVQLHLDTGIR